MGQKRVRVGGCVEGRGVTVGSDDSARGFQVMRTYVVLVSRLACMLPPGPGISQGSSEKISVHIVAVEILYTLVVVVQLDCP